MNPLSMLQAGQFQGVAWRLNLLGRQLGDVSGKVRVAIVDAIRATVADMARDAVDRVLRRLPQQRAPIPPPEYRPEYDPWEEADPDQWPEPVEEDDLDSLSPAAASVLPAVSGTAAVALTVAAWWLRLRGTLLGALAVALTAAALAAFGKRLEWDALPLIDAAGELFNLQRFLAAVAALLARA